MSKLEEFLKVPMAVLYYCKDNEVAELLLRYGRPSEDLRRMILIMCSPYRCIHR